MPVLASRPVAKEGVPARGGNAVSAGAQRDPRPTDPTNSPETPPARSPRFLSLNALAAMAQKFMRTPTRYARPSVSWMEPLTAVEKIEALLL